MGDAIGIVKDTIYKIRNHAFLIIVYNHPTSLRKDKSEAMHRLIKIITYNHNQLSQDEVDSKYRHITFILHYLTFISIFISLCKIGSSYSYTLILSQRGWVIIHYY